MKIKTLEEILENRGENDALFLKECVKIAEDYFAGLMRDEFVNVVAGLLDLVEDFSDDEGICDMLNDHIIWADQEWAILRHYCNPHEADYYGAECQFYDDFVTICGVINRELLGGE